MCRAQQHPLVQKMKEIQQHADSGLTGLATTAAAEDVQDMGQQQQPFHPERTGSDVTAGAHNHQARAGSRIIVGSSALILSVSFSYHI